MKKLVPIPAESLKRLKKDDVKDFGHQFVSVRLKDGRFFPQAVASEGCLIQVKGFREIPFVETDIESVDADGEPWVFRRRAVRTRTPPRK
jgi:putative SOS response-associated peptidase YedK